MSFSQQHKMKHCCHWYHEVIIYLYFYSEHMQNQLSARDQRIAKTICKLCLGFLICNVPVIIYKGIYGYTNQGNGYVLFFFSALFWMQSSINFILYAASNKQYRDTI